MKALIFSFLLLLGACASTQPSVQSPQQRIYALKADYLAPQTAMARYAQLPRCKSSSWLSKEPCSKPEAVSEMRKANAEAVAALDAAEQVVRNPKSTANSAELALAAASRAVDVVRNVLSNYGVMK